VAQLGANAHGQVLVPGRVPDCYLGATALWNTAAVRAPACDRVRPHAGTSTAVACGSSGPGPGPGAPARGGMAAVAAARTPCPCW
jgi:hypothetical protein